MACATAAALFCLSAPANALLAGLGGMPIVNATWNNSGSDFGDPINWTPNTDIPNGIATFADPAPIFIVSLPNFPWLVQTLNFASAAGAYTFETTTGNSILFGGIVNASASVQTFNIINGGFIGFGDAANLPARITINVIDGELRFQDQASAGNATINNNSAVNFIDNSSADNATFTNNVSGIIRFNDQTTAANATFTNDGQIEFLGNSTAANATITNNCCLRFFDMSSAGSATITNNSTGTTSFFNSASAANSTINNAGTIEFADQATAGNATITNQASGTIRFNAITNTGTDTATAGNANIVNDGLMQFYRGSTAGNATIVSNTAIQFFHDSTAGNATITVNDSLLTFANNSNGGNARFIVNGFGFVDFSGSLGPGGLGQLTAGSFEGDGYISIAGTMTVGSNNLSTEFSGSISDGCGCLSTGSLVKVGTGTFTLSGFNTYSGTTDIQQGELHLTGVIQSFNTVTVHSGAVLSGDGAIFGELFINGGAIFRPSGFFGQMSVFGNVTFENNSRFQVTLDATGGTTAVGNTGTVTINGGTVEVTALPGTYTAGTQYYIIQSGGGVTGMFTGVLENLAFFDFNVIYDPGAVILELFRNANTFNTFALTRNQLGVAGALDAADPSSALLQSLSGLTPEQARAILDLLSGEIHATMSGAFIDESNLLRNAILARLRNTAFSGISGPLGYLSEQNEEALAYAGANRANPFRALRPANRGLEYWTQAFGSWTKYDSDGNAANAKRATGGFVTGFDRLSHDNIRAGISAGYSNTSASVPVRQSKANADTFHLAAYLSKLDGRWSYRTGIAASVHGVDAERTALGVTLNSDYLAFTGQVFGEIALANSWRQIAFEPFANLALIYNRIGSFTETGGIPALISNGADNVLGFTTIGIRAASRHQMQNGWVLIPRTMLAWQHAIGALAPEATLTFQNTGTSFTVAGTPLSRDMLLAEAGFDIRLSPAQLLGFTYSATLANDSTEHGVRGKYEWKF